MFGSALGLSIVAGSMAVAMPASATLWRNYASNGKTPLFLTIPNNLNKGQPATLQVQNNLTSQSWQLVLDKTRPGGFSFISFLHPPPPNINLILGVSAGIMSPGRPVIDWVPQPDANQSWTDTGTTLFDDHSAPCIAFLNEATPPGHNYVMSVSGSAVPNAPIVIRDFDGGADQYWCRYESI
ncbi:MAG TPA: hypothetical protein VMI54_11200 [Polyangiaceae bacterium]|nr:hypothetical protein [Polyangiaceae bacterium]